MIRRHLRGGGDKEFGQISRVIGCGRWGIRTNELSRILKDMSVHRRGLVKKNSEKADLNVVKERIFITMHVIKCYRTMHKNIHKTSVWKNW